jgi:hypothetical protein
MKRCIFFLLFLTFFSCSESLDDTHSVCTSDCTTLQGRFVTNNNIGISGVKVSIEFQKGGGIYPSYTRKIGEAFTNDEGYYHKQFYIKDSELGNSQTGFFMIFIDDSNLNVDDYILSDNLVGTSTMSLDFGIPNISSRDTIIEHTFYLPKKAHIVVNLNNFIPIQNGDYFEVQTFFPYGQKVGLNDFLNSEYSTGFSGFGTFRADNINSQHEPFVAENDQNVIRIVRRKNGINTIEDFPMFVPSDNTIELNFDY